MANRAKPTRYHVEVRRTKGLGRAWEFNLDSARLTAGVVDPWLAGRSFVFGDRRWEPAESELQILEGPELEAVDLDRGQGPGAAERVSRNVTREILAGRRGDVEDDAAARAAAEIIAALRVLDGVEIENEKAPDLVAERLRSFGFS